MSDPKSDVEAEDALSSIRRLVSEKSAGASAKENVAKAGTKGAKPSDEDEAALVLTSAFRVKGPGGTSGDGNRKEPELKKRAKEEKTENGVKSEMSNFHSAVKKSEADKDSPPLRSERRKSVPIFFDQDDVGPVLTGSAQKDAKQATDLNDTGTDKDGGPDKGRLGKSDTDKNEKDQTSAIGEVVAEEEEDANSVLKFIKRETEQSYDDLTPEDLASGDLASEDAAKIGSDFEAEAAASVWDADGAAALDDSDDGAIVFPIEDEESAGASDEMGAESALAETDDAPLKFAPRTASNAAAADSDAAGGLDSATADVSETDVSGSGASAAKAGDAKAGEKTEGPAETKDNSTADDAPFVPEAPAISAAALSMVDDVTLRRIVSDVVRDELSGELGEVITKNLRKIIRREINRAVSSGELE